MFAAAKDVWIPLIHRNITATAKYCKNCLEAAKNLKPDIPKSDMGETYVSKEPNDLVQLDFWGPVNYVRGRKKYVLVAVDTFSHWPSAYVCSSNKSKNVLKFLMKYINTHGHPRKLHMDQATGFFSNEIQNFCNYEGIELIKFPVRDHRATGMVERTIGSIKNYVLTYLQEDKNYKFGAMISRALSALRFVPRYKTKLTPFEAYHGREANTALRNLTKKPSLKNLNWNNVVNQKLSCLDKAGNLPDVELTLDWEKRSNLVYAPQNRKAPIFLDDEVVGDPKAQEVVDPKEIRSVPKAPTWLKKHKTSATTVYQRTGKTDPKDPRRYKRLPLKIEKLTKHTVQMEKGSLLRRSGVSFRSAAEESLIENRSDACTPGPSKRLHSTPGPSEPTKYKRRAEKDRVEMENARRSTKQRIVEYSADESEDDEDSEWEIERNEPVKITVSKGDDIPSGTARERSPRTVGGKRKKGECEAATRKSTRQRRGVDKMGGAMIHRIEHK